MSNPYKKLSTMIDAVEKLYLLPENEITKNGELMEGIRNAFSAHSIDGIINSAMQELSEIKNHAANTGYNHTHLLHSYAARENDRVKHAEVKNEYITEIVKADDCITEKPMKPSKEADQKFSSVFNSVYSEGAVKINAPGDPSTLMTYIDYSPYRVNFAEYLSMPTLPEMVDRPLAIALKKFPTVNSENQKFDDAVEKAIHKKKIKSVMKDAMFFSLLSPRGSLVVPIQRGDSVTFNVFNDTQFAYGMGSSYSGVTQPYHSTRVGDLYCMGAKLRHGVSAFFTCPGYEPLFGVGLNRLPQLRTAAEAWNLYVHILKILMVRSQVIIEKMEGDIQTDTMLAKMRSQLQRLSQTMGVGTPIEQARGMELDILNNNISPGTADIASVFKDYVGSVTGVSPEFFFGGGTAAYSQAAFQIASTNENIHSRYQIGEIEPLLRFMVNTMIRYDKDLQGFGVEEDDFKIEFESIYDETQIEKVDRIGKETEILIRQCSYPELQEAFKKEGLLSEDIDLPALKEPYTGDGKEIDDDHTDGILAKPLG
jgi:hypothetical protein